MLLYMPVTGRAHSDKALPVANDFFEFIFQVFFVVVLKNISRLSEIDIARGSVIRAADGRYGICHRFYYGNGSRLACARHDVDIGFLIFFGNCRPVQVL